LTGHSGVNNDAHVFWSLLLFKKMEEGTLIPGTPMFHYASIPPIILGDGAYLLCKWFMKPYAVPTNEQERHYNKVFNQSRDVVERVFGCLKSICHNGNILHCCAFRPLVHTLRTEWLNEGPINLCLAIHSSKSQCLNFEYSHTENKLDFE
ncbi:hypothetical protein JRQ81_020013, partial [Phrynocephalus forsythii]